MPLGRDHWLNRYAGAMVAVALAVVARALLRDVIGDQIPSVTYFPAIIFATWYGGMGPGMLVVAGLLGMSRLFPPLPSLPTERLELVWQTSFGVFAVVASLLVASTSFVRHKVKQAEADRAFLQVTLQSIGEGVVVTDDKGRLETLNPAAEALLGSTISEIRGSHIDDAIQFVPQESQQSLENPATRCLRERRIINLSHRIVMIVPKGRRYMVDVSAAPIRDADDRIQGAALVIREGTERHEAEVTCARYAAILTASADSVISFALDGTITTWNTGAERQFGYAVSEICGKPWQILLPPGEATTGYMRIKQFFHGELVEHFELRFARRDRTTFPASVGLALLKNSRGEIIGTSAIVRDITDQVKTLAALRESEERFHTLADNIAPLAWMADGNGSIFWYNQRWFDFSGMTLEELQGRGWQILLHSDHRRRVAEQMEQAFQSGLTWDNTFPLLGRDATYRWFLSRAIALRDTQGKVYRWFGTNTDVTKLLEAHQALDEANRRKDEFLAMLGHELRNPLAGIVTGVQALRLLTSNDNTTELQEIIERQAAHMTRLVDELLDVSRIAKGRLTVRQEAMDLVKMVRTAVHDFVSAHPEGHDAIQLRLPAGPIWILGDATRLTQVVTNLIHNAFKFSDRSPAVQLTLRADTRNSRAVLSVTDQGMGMTPQTLARIFEPFLQADSSAGRNRGGMGLGLYLAQGIIKLHQGELVVHSRGLNQGTQATVYLPLSNAPLANNHTADAPTIAPQTVLLIDDRRDATLPLRRILESLGHRVILANDASSGIAAADAAHPDIVLCDIGLTGERDGYHVARELRSRPHTSGTYLVALTGYGQEVDRMHAREARFDFHMTKPITIEQLHWVLHARPSFE